MKTTYNTIITLLLIPLLALSAIGQSVKKANPYGLNVVSDTATYNALVEQNPHKALINIKNFAPDIALDIRYATDNNFCGEQIYNSPEAFVRKPVAEALKKVQADLKEMGMGLKVFDAYRPYSATVKFYEVYPDTNFVAAPWRGSVHNRGCAVDVTLIDLKTNKQLEMPTPFDDFTNKASHSYNDLSEHVLKNRQTLRDIMIKHGFQIYEAEWWHYNFKGWKNYGLMDISFEELID